MRFWVISLVMVMLALKCAAQPAADARNAAVWYQRAYERYHAIYSSMNEDERMAVYNFEGELWRGATAAARQSLARFEPVTELVNRATQLDQCDFDRHNAEWDQNPFEQLGHLRLLAHWQHYDLYLRLADGDEAGAMQRVQAIMRMSEHAASEPGINGPLVGEAIFHFSISSARDALDHGLLNQTDAQALLDQVRRADTDDPFHYRQAVNNLRRETVDWMTEQFGGEGGVEKLAVNSQWLVGDDLMSQMRVAAMTQGDLNAAIRKLGMLADRITAAFALNDDAKTKAELATIDEEIKRGEQGPFAENVFGFVSRFPDNMVRAKKTIAEFRMLIEPIARGEIDPKTLANAAVWYMRAVRLMESMKPETIQMLLEYARTPAMKPSSEITQSLREAQLVLDAIHQGSLLARCDFSNLDHAWGATALAIHHVPLHDAARMIRAKVAWLGLQEPPAKDEAVDLLATMLRFGAHLAQEKSMLSSLIAQVIACDARTVLGDQRLSDAQMTNIRDALKGFHREDPFGYSPALAEARAAMKPWLSDRWGTKFQLEAREREAADIVEKCSSEQVLWMLIANDEAYKDPRIANSGPLERLQRLDDIISMPALLPAMPMARTIRTLVEQHDLDQLAAMDYPVICDVQKRIDRSRDDLKQIQQLVAGATTMPAD